MFDYFKNATLEYDGGSQPVVIESIDQDPWVTRFTGILVEPYWYNQNPVTVKKSSIPEDLMIKDVIFNNPATIVLWTDGTKTVVKCQDDDIYDKEMGLALCIAKKALGNKGNFNNVFKKWIPEEESNVTITLSDNPVASIAQNVMAKFKEALHEKKGETNND